MHPIQALPVAGASSSSPARGAAPLRGLVGVVGSPSGRSRSAALLEQLEARLVRRLGAGLQPRRIAVRDLPPAALLLAQAQEPAMAEAIDALCRARVVLISTPIYKAAYSGLLKAFLDLLPQDALRGKTVVPLATGGSPAHLLALDYALKPVLGTLGARDIRDAIYASDAQLLPHAGGHAPTVELADRLDRVADDLLADWPAQALRVALLGSSPVGLVNAGTRSPQAA